MRYTTVAITAVGVMLMGIANAGRAQENTPPAGDITRGKAIAAETCAACHGAQGISVQPGVPHLAGQYPAYIVAGLAAYRRGDRKDENMAPVAAQLAEADMANVAAYFASLPPFRGRPRPVAPPVALEAAPFAEIQGELSECASCHGDDGNSLIPGTPSLAGQHAPYLMAAVKSYVDGSRASDEMAPFVGSLDGSMIEDMAYYYSAMVPKEAKPPTEGDALAGISATASCVNCHAIDGNNKDPKTPRLAGLDAEYLVAAIEAYRTETRKHSAMHDAVATLRSADIKNIAAYYTSKPPKALPVAKPLTTREWVEQCNRCHGPGGKSTDSRFPVLAGQDETYLTKTLKLYHGGERSNSMMYAMSFLMAESDIRKLAAYYAGQTAP